MNIKELAINDLFLIDPKVHSDDRGYFYETFRLDFLEDAINKKINFVQDNESMSSKGVLRGLHFQLPPFDQSKLVRVLQGKVLDVAVDIRKESHTFGKYIAVELSDKNKCQLFIPSGFAHGYVVLSDTAVFSYKVDNYYSPSHEEGIAFDDSELGINWQLSKKDLILSDKDQKYGSLSDFNYKLF
jgi:dTDP-4-dehydrorhamnose 3,5-epimerase